MTDLTNGVTSASYTYTGDGVRVGRSVNGSATTYLQDLSAGLPIVLSETTGSNTSRYVYGSDLIAQTDGAAISYFHTDGLGSTRALTNSAGVATDQYLYNAFGSERSHTGASTNSFTYTGEQVDLEAGLTFLRARYYDATLGRFVSKDKFPAMINEAQSQNRYVYVQNNPINLTDPTGNAWYDFLDAEKNGINNAVRSLWNDTGAGEYIVQNTPVVNDLVATAESMDTFSQNYGRRYELITSNMTEADQQEFDRAENTAMQALDQGLSSASHALMTTPGTSLNPSLSFGGWGNYLPGPIKNLYKALTDPFGFLIDKSIDEPIRDIPSQYIHYQFRNKYNNTNTGSVLGINTNNGHYDWSDPPSKAK